MRKRPETEVSEKEKHNAKKEGRKKPNWEGLEWVRKRPHEKEHKEAKREPGSPEATWSGTSNHVGGEIEKKRSENEVDVHAGQSKP